MKSGFNLLLLLGCSSVLTACGGGGGSSDTPAVEYETCGEDSPITSIDDSLFGYQWYLENTGQTALTADGSGGVAGEDINIFAAGQMAQGYSGDCIKIAVVDSDLEIAHEDLQQNVVPDASYNFTYVAEDTVPSNGQGLHNPTATYSSGGHGTSVAGYLAARGGNALGITGVAPSAELRGYNMLLAQDYPNELAALGYQDTVNNGNYPELTSPQVDIFNLSYGRTITYDLPSGEELYYVVLVYAQQWGTENLREGKGALYFKAAGNEFSGHEDSEYVNPADNPLPVEKCTQAIENGVTCFNTNLERDQAYPFVIPVGAFNAEGERASYASTGSSIWIAAPGGEYGQLSPAMLTTDQSGCDAGYSQTDSTYSSSDFDNGNTQENLECNYISIFNGTSAATPIISGAAALLLEANPALTWRDIKHILATTARKIDPGYAEKTLTLGLSQVVLEDGWVDNAAGYHFSNYFGFGALDADAAISMAKNGYSLLPAMQLLPGDNGFAGPVTNTGEIPDASASGISETLSVNETGNPIVESVQLIISLSGTDGLPNYDSEHPEIEATNFDFSDYQILLESPNGTQSILMTPFHGFDKQQDIIDYPMISHAFYGENLNGDWKLIVRDLDSQAELTGEGKLVDWSLKFYVHES
ncbi:S8 family serine peptidase [Thiomicrorhabdus xiamenensis]|uniref:S8 family serine peptidase n=1 Tax=Thiomicrorhabdus xiamenensis TaxID=2739063 RepID=A0A7D4T1G2_9GAMM|nr:S8 family serine peptidase [Thiomicrorhabdus xiamenensis]QKI89902.1 S8 family serine peptidase [Thiomicrorhabdus xiamenensis]